MAIEPISSVMTFQAQGSVVQKPQASVETEKPESSSANSTSAVEYVDKTTNVVENSKEKGQSNNGDQGQDQQAYHEKVRKAVETLNKKMSNSEAVLMLLSLHWKMPGEWIPPGSAIVCLNGKQVRETMGTASSEQKI